MANKHLTKQFELPDGMTRDQIVRFAATAIIVNDQNQVLMMMRDDCPVWINIGGLVDEGEEFEEALHRETMEEAGVEIDIVKFGCDYFSLASYERSDLYKHDKTYLCKIKEGQTPVLGNEGIALAWFDLDDLPKNIPPRYITKMTEIRTGQLVPKILTHASTRHFIKQCPISDMHRLEEWRNHSKVLKKKALDRLIYWPE